MVYGIAVKISAQSRYEIHALLVDQYIGKVEDERKHKGDGLHDTLSSVELISQS
jgi:hypothetical protein